MRSTERQGTLYTEKVCRRKDSYVSEADNELIIAWQATVQRFRAALQGHLR
jgi:hypothetical protein